MLDALAAGGVAIGLGVAMWPGARGLVVPAVVGASSISIAVSIVALIGPGRTSGVLSALESLALLGLVFLGLRRGPAPAGARAAVAAIAAGLLSIPAHVTADDSVLANVAGMAVLGVGALLAWGAAWYLGALDARRARSVAEARRRQRLSLARDLHDFVAHDVSAIVVQAQAGQVVGASDPAEALAALERIEEAGQHALTTMDRAVDVLRDAGPAPDGRRPEEPWEGLDALPELAARFDATGVVRVELELEAGIAETVPSDVGRMAYRLVTEALTNVRRHASGPTRVGVAVESRQQARAPALAVTVADDGAVTGAPEGGGSGLAVLREGVESLGGTLRAGRGDHGWEVRAVLPLRDRARPPVDT
jgi:signal transduction histidine kinase